MQKVSMRNFSLLGLVLMGASAITAAILPKDRDHKTFAGATLVTSTNPDLGNGINDEQTCKAGSPSANSCVITAGTNTSAVANTSDLDTKTHGSDSTWNNGNILNTSQSPV
jgi:hypothetical protein